MTVHILWLLPAFGVGVLVGFLWCHSAKQYNDSQ